MLRFAVKHVQILAFLSKGICSTICRLDYLLERPMNDLHLSVVCVYKTGCLEIGMALDFYVECNSTYMCEWVNVGLRAFGDLVGSFCCIINFVICT